MKKKSSSATAQVSLIVSLQLTLFPLPTAAWVYDMKPDHSSLCPYIKIFTNGSDLGSLIMLDRTPTFTATV